MNELNELNELNVQLNELNVPIVFWSCVIRDRPKWN